MYRWFCWIGSILFCIFGVNLFAMESKAKEYESKSEDKSEDLTEAENDNLDQKEISSFIQNKVIQNKLLQRLLEKLNTNHIK